MNLVAQRADGRRSNPAEPAAKPEDTQVSGMLVHDLLESSAARLSEKIALVSGSQRLSFAQIESAANRLAHALMRGGVRRGDRVAVFLNNCPETAVAIFGISKAGGVFVCLSRAMKADKLVFILNDCQTTVLVTDARAQSQGLAARCLRDVPSLREVIVCDSFGEAALPDAERCRKFSAIQTCEPDSRPPRAGADEELACLIYTSGTTGEPKGVMCAHDNVLFATEAIVQYLGNTRDDVVLNVLPLSFTYGLYQLLTMMKAGGTLVLENSFAFPAAILERMQQERVTGFPGVPTIYSMLLKQNLEACDLSALRYLTNAAAGLPPTQVAEIRRRLPRAAFFSMYGQTETARTLYLPPELAEQKPASVGIPIPGTEVWLEDGEGRGVGPGETGELIVRGRHVMRGYWNAPEATAERFVPGSPPGERVCRTGDLFRVDEGGCYYFVSRKDDIIKSRGEKVAPREVENAIQCLKGVLHVAVVGVPDPVWGEAIKAVLVVEPGTITANQVLAHCRASLEDFMVPKIIEFRESLPMTPNGKIKRNELT